VTIFSPIQHSVYSLGTKINTFYGRLVGQGDLAKTNQQLTDEVRRLTVENAQLETRLEESQQISQQEDFIAASGLVAITAKVIGRTPAANWQAIIIDKGSEDGIEVDFPLVSAEGIIIGKIFEVKKSSAQAILINDSRSRIAALVENESKSQGVVIGEHGLSLKMELIGQNEVVKEGETVVTSGLEPTIPRGLVIGKISRVLAEPNSFFQTAFIQSLVKVDSLVVVSVLKSVNDD